MSIGIFIIVAVLGIVGTGWYLGQYQPLHQTAIRVNDTEFNMDYYIKTLKLFGEGQSINYVYSLASEVVRIIEEGELVRQGAMKLGISVSDKEVDEELKSREPPLSRDYRDVVRTEMLVSKLRDEYFDPQVPRFAAQRHIMAMLLESKSQATEVAARLKAGEDFATLAGELSLDSLSKAEEGDLGWHSEEVLAELLATSVPGEHAFSLDAGVLSQPVYDAEISKGLGYWLLEVLERREVEETEEAHVQGILLGNEVEAQAARARLEAGEDFATLAAELSQTGDAEETGGDLGWLTPGIIVSDFDDFIFDSEVELGTLSEPIRDEGTVTTGGYWLLMVLDIDDNREISDEDRDLLKNSLLYEWFSALWDDPENEVDHSYLDDEKIMWAVDRVVGS